MSETLNSPIFDDLKEEQVANPDLIMIQRYWYQFQQAERAVAPKHAIWETIDTFDRGEQWKDAAIPPWIPKPVTNYMRYARTMKRANLAAEIPKATFSPVTEEDKKDVTQLQAAYDHVWEESHVNRMIRRCIDRGTSQGTSIGYVYYDDGVIGGKYYGTNDPRNNMYQGQIKVKRFPNANFFPDPDAYRLQQCKFIETTELVPLSQIKNNPTFKEYAGVKLEQYKGTQVEMDGDANGEIFARDNYPSQNSVLNLGQDQMVTLHCHWERYLNENGKWQLDISYYIRNSDFFLYRIEDAQPNIYPFAMYYDEEEENDIWGTSMQMDILENQKVLNKLAQTAAIIAMMHQNPQKVVQRESGINAQDLARTGTLAGKVWTSNIPNPIEFLQHPDIPQGVFDLEERIKNDIREITGMGEAYTGQNVGSLTTSTGVDSLIERASIRDKDKTIQIDGFVEEISHIIALFIIHHWTEPRTVSQRMPNGDTLFTKFKPFAQDTIDNLSWKVKSDVYARSPMTQASKRQQADKLMQMQGQFQFNPPIITPEEWIQMQEFDMKEQILARMEEDRKRLQSQDVSQMTQQMMQLVDQAITMAMKGAAVNDINQELQNQVTQLLQETQSTGASQSTQPNGSVGQAPQAKSGSPSAPMGQIAAANMASGS